MAVCFDVEHGDVHATVQILALAEDRSPIFIEDSDDIVVICQDGVRFAVEGNTYSIKPCPVPSGLVPA